jgi:hypothetical protein
MMPPVFYRFLTILDFSSTILPSAGWIQDDWGFSLVEISCLFRVTLREVHTVASRGAMTNTLHV